MNIRKILAPSTIITNTIDALKRFPFVLMATIYLGYLLRVLNYSKSQQTELAFECLAVSLAVPLLVAAASLRESFKKSSWFIFADLIVLLIPIVFLMSSDISYLEKNVFRYLLLLASAHLLVAFAPFLIFKSETAFWEFNKRLFLRFLLSSLYSGILYIGIALILSVLEFLFHVTTGQIYLDAFLVCALIFQPLHFLSSFPKDVRSLEHDHAYPRGLKIFCQNLLLPLITVFGILVLVYGFKILITMTWPKGLVSLFIIVFSVAGSFTLLLLNPLTKESGSWISKYQRGFHVAEALMAVLLFAAVTKRVGEYGVTESRYLGYALAFWIFGVSLYMLFSRAKNILYIPLSLCILSVLVSFGPWGIFEVSLMSQQNRMEAFLKKHNLIDENGRLKAGQLNMIEYTKIEEMYSHIKKYYGQGAINEIILDVEDLNALRKQVVILDEAKDTREFINVELPDRQLDSHDVPTYKKMVLFKKPLIKILDKPKKGLFIEVNDHDLRIFKDGAELGSWTFVEIINNLKLTDGRTASPIRFAFNKNNFQGMLFIHHLAGNRDSTKNEVKVTDLEGILFY